ALDALTREDMNLELQRIWMNRRITVLLVTHDLNEALLLADRVVVMSDRPGKVIFERAIDLPRPRSSAIKYDPRFLEAHHQIYEALQGGSRGTRADAMNTSAARPPEGASCAPSGGSEAAKPQAWGHTSDARNG